MVALFVLGSIWLIVLLLKCIYTNIEKPPASAPPPPPTLEETLVGVLSYFKAHISQMSVYNDRVVVYCFKASPDDNVVDYNEITIRYCDIGFKPIIDDECNALRENLTSAIMPPPKS